MKLSILIPALASRDSTALLATLHRQAAEYPGEVEILVETDNGENTSGRKRNVLTDRACGDYIAFVDDDDMVSDDYIMWLLSGIVQEPEVVSFGLRRSQGRFLETWFLSGNADKACQGLMSLNHLCAWRKDIACRVRWCESLGYADDQLWYKPLVNSQPSWNEYKLWDILYHYNFNRKTSVNHREAKITVAHHYFRHGIRCFFDSIGSIVLEVHQDDKPCDPDLIFTRNSLNEHAYRSLKSLTLYLTCVMK